MKRSLFSGLLFVVCFAVSCNAQTWLGEALQCQRYLQRANSFNLVTVGQTHNSFNNPDRGYTLAPNQKLTITEQLDLGVRSLELDLHNIAALTPPIRVCHGSQDTYDSCQENNFRLCGVAGIVDYGPSTGCKSDALTVPETLSEIANWLNDNPNEFVMVWMESTGDISAEFINIAISAAFPSGVFTPADLGSDPYPTLEELAAGGFKIFFASKDNTWGGTYVHDVDQWPGFPHKKIKYFDASTCQSTNLGTTPPSPVEFGVFYGDESALLGVIDGAEDVGVLDETNAPGVYDCGYSAAFDNIWSKKMKATIWSWDRSRPTRDTTLNCAVLGSNNFWEDADCDASLAFACQSDTDSRDWTISTEKGAWTASAGKCPSGYSFAVPHLAIENAMLKEAKTTSGETRVWLNLNDRTTEGTWTDGLFAQSSFSCVSTGVEDTPDVEESTGTGQLSLGTLLQYSLGLLFASMIWAISF